MMTKEEQIQTLTERSNALAILNDLLEKQHKIIQNSESELERAKRLRLKIEKAIRAEEEALIWVRMTMVQEQKVIDIATSVCDALSSAIHELGKIETGDIL